jgi:aminoglycoside 3-N-acetyltransferase
MTHTRESLRRDLAELGLDPGDVVMVHASCRAVGPVIGGPDEIHCAVVDAVSPGGTMMMLAGCPDGYDDVGRGHLTAEEEAEILAHMPAFDKHAVRANRDVGTLAEFFRSWPGTLASDCVAVRMVARGARADWLVADHRLDYPFGRGTPFERLLEARGKVLLLGSDHDEVTLMHYAEHKADFPDKIVARYQCPLLKNGERVWVMCEEFDSSSAGCHALWPDRFFALIVDDFIAHHDGANTCRTGRVGSAASFLLDAAALVQHALPIMVDTANGRPYFDAKPIRSSWP